MKNKHSKEFYQVPESWKNCSTFDAPRMLINMMAPFIYAILIAATLYLDAMPTFVRFILILLCLMCIGEFIRWSLKSFFTPRYSLKKIEFSHKFIYK